MYIFIASIFCELFTVAHKYVQVSLSYNNKQTSTKFLFNSATVLSSHPLFLFSSPDSLTNKQMTLNQLF